MQKCHRGDSTVLIKTKKEGRRILCKVGREKIGLGLTAPETTASSK